jgi:hypothetical protein
MTQADAGEHGTDSSRFETDPNHRTRTPINRILERLSQQELPEKEHFESYLRHKWRANHKRRTIDSSFASIMLFLDFYKKSGKTELRQIERSDLEAFIEHEQDRGIKITTVKTRLACIVAFLHFLIEQDLIPGGFLKKRIRFKLPETLPRAMNPEDVKKLISIIDHTRDRALISSSFENGHQDRRGIGPYHERCRSQGQEDQSVPGREERHGEGGLSEQ